MKLFTLLFISTLLTFNFANAQVIPGPPLNANNPCNNYSEIKDKFESKDYQLKTLFEINEDFTMQLWINPETNFWIKLLVRTANDKTYGCVIASGPTYADFDLKAKTVEN